MSESPAETLLLEGELDLATAPALGRAIDEADAGVAELVVDLSALSFMDSSGLAMLIRAAHDGRRRVRLRDPQPRIRRLLELTGTLEVFVVE